MNTAMNTVFKANMNTAATKRKEDDSKKEKDVSRLQIKQRKSEKGKNYFRHFVSFYQKSWMIGNFLKCPNPLCLLGFRHATDLKMNTLNMVHFVGVNGMVESEKLTFTEHLSAAQKASISLCALVF